MWEATSGQNRIARLFDETGGEAFFLGLQTPVSFGPFLDGVQTALNNQYLLKFRAGRVAERERGPFRSAPMFLVWRFCQPSSFGSPPPLNSRSRTV